MTAVADWVRPWFPAGLVGHLDADCPELLRWVSEPAEGPGWLDPHSGEVCRTCVIEKVKVPEWDAECRTCMDRMSDEWDDNAPLTKDDAETWKDEHHCKPSVHLISPDQKKAAT